jgi:hypothetical protein
VWPLRSTDGTKHLPILSSDLQVQALWTLRPDAYTPRTIQSDAAGNREETKNMARRKLTVAEQLKGIEKALASPRTPPQLKEGLRRRGNELRKVLERAHKDRRRPGLARLFGR